VCWLLQEEKLMLVAELVLRINYLQAMVLTNNTFFIITIITLPIVII
jgi:hypothetical protein